MATDDDTSKPRRSRRNHPQATAASVGAAPLAAADLPPQPTPRTLEEAVENARTLMMEIRAVLHCLSDVLLYADDDDSVMHAEVARSTADWANHAAAELDLVKLRPLIEAIRQRGGGTPSDGEPGLTNLGPNQVREPRPVYLA
jgi:hypothetical protein